MRRICRERRGILIGVLLAVLAGCHSVNAPQSQPSGVTAEAASTQTASRNKSSSDRPSGDRPSGAAAPDRASPDRADSDSADFGPSLSGPSAAETPTVILVPAQSICQNLQRQFEQIFLSTRQLHQRLFGLAEKQRRRLAADQRGYWPTLSLLANPRQPLHGQFARLLNGYVVARQHFIQQRCPFTLPPSPVQQIKQMDSCHFQQASWTDR